ncbi:MAG: N-acetylneuraminate synthase family protein [Desulfobacterales bacterium]|nr:N-acetylneuraminate synthase family protein [Desulfobacterales bacterium]
MNISPNYIGNCGVPCFIIAEVGLNHNGDFDLARRSIEAAARCGVDAVKFQNFKTEDFLTDRTMQYTYKSQGKEITEPLYNICKRSEFRREWIGPLKALCDKLEIEFMSTPTSEGGVMDLVNAGVKILKNGSDYLTHIPLLKFMGQTGLPVIVSTGMAYFGEIDDVVNAVKASGNEQIILLHCVSNYPTHDKDVNLRRMVALRERYGLPVGFSDHTLGWLAAVQAVTLGAVAIEKHFTLDKNLPGPDHWFSLDPAELKTYVEEIRRAELRMGRQDISPAQGEIQIRDEYRLGIVVARRVEKGQLLAKEDVAFRKPCRGLLPKELEEYLGKRFTVSLDVGQPIKAKHFE